MFLSRATEKIGSYTEDLSCVHVFRALGSCTPLVSYGRVLWGLPLLPPLHGSCAHGGCFYRLADSTSKYVRSWRLRTLFSILVVCILFGILWNESFLCRSLLAASLGEKEKEEESARQPAKASRAKGRKEGVKEDRTFTNAIERVCARYEGERVRKPERCVGSDRSSSFEARQRTSEQRRHGTAIESIHAIFAKIKSTDTGIHLRLKQVKNHIVTKHLFKQQLPTVLRQQINRRCNTLVCTVHSNEALVSRSVRFGYDRVGRSAYGVRLACFHFREGE